VIIPHLSNAFLELENHAILLEFPERFGGLLALGKGAELGFGGSAGLDTGLGDDLVVWCDRDIGSGELCSDLARDKITSEG